MFTSPGNPRFINLINTNMKKEDLTNLDVIHCPSKSLYDRVSKIYPTPSDYIEYERGGYAYRPIGKAQSHVSWYQDPDNYIGGKPFNIISAEDFLKANDPEYINDSYTLI